MAFWKKLEDDLSEELRKLTEEELWYRNPYQSIIEDDQGGFRSDGCISNGEYLLAVEVEAGQPHLDTNTAEYWFIQARRHQFHKIVMLHIYTPDFNSYGSRKELADFLAEQMSGEFDFKQHVIDYRKKSENDYPTILEETKDRVRFEFRKLFGGA